MILRPLRVQQLGQLVPTLRMPHALLTFHVDVDLPIPSERLPMDIHEEDAEFVA
jgi:hypothetical protein